jgi:hypothetical protein
MNMRVLTLMFLSVVMLSAVHCTKKQPPSDPFLTAQTDDLLKGRLEIKQGCGTYTIKVLEGNIDSSLIEASWTDPNTGKSYENVFGLGSPCNFPNDINEGDEFYFKVEPHVQNCMLCQAIYPMPQKKLSITVYKIPVG